MPQLLRWLSRFSVVRRCPIPTLKNYMVLSAFLAFGAFYHSYRMTFDEERNKHFQEWVLDEVSDFLSPKTKQWLAESMLFRIFFYCLADQTTIWIMVNSMCCAVAIFGYILRWIVFGRLRAQETQQLRDRCWNFMFHKFVFVFGVLNATYVDEVGLWTFWFMAVGLIYLLTSLAQDRLKYMASAPTNGLFQHRLVVMTSFSCIASCIMLGMSVTGGYKFGAHYGLFMAAEAAMLLLRAGYCTFRYGAHLYYLRREQTWERCNASIYYAELLFEMSVSLIDLFHHLHMLMWGQIVLSMASLVMVMQIRYIYLKIDARLRRHKNYKRITQHMDQHYPMACFDDLTRLDDPCAICWDRMDTARKLPCGHLFHNCCLRGWLEQDTTCPTCRLTLSVGSQSDADDDRRHPINQNDPDSEIRRRRINHFFHFDGRRYARWLPSFSVEVSHNLGTTAFFPIQAPVTDSQLTTMVSRVVEMFPQLPLPLIMDDLRETGSSQATVENILEGRLFDTEIGVNTDLLDEETSNEMTVESVEIGSPSTSSSWPSTESPVVSLSTGMMVGGRFSKSSDERELILDERKKSLVDVHRRRYLQSARGVDILHLYPLECTNSATSISHHQQPQESYGTESERRISKSKPD